MNQKTWEEIKPSLLEKEELREGVEWVDRVLNACINIIKKDTGWNMNEEKFSLPEGAVTIEYPKYMSKESVADMAEFVNLVLKKARRSYLRKITALDALKEG